MTARPGRIPVNEALIVARYVKAGWSITRAAREQGIGTKKARAILDAAGVQIRGPVGTPGDTRIAAVYERLGSVKAVKHIIGGEHADIVAALERTGTPRTVPPKPEPVRYTPRGLATSRSPRPAGSEHGAHGSRVPRT